MTRVGLTANEQVLIRVHRRWLYYALHSIERDIVLLHSQSRSSSEHIDSRGNSLWRWVVDLQS